MSKLTSLKSNGETKTIQKDGSRKLFTLPTTVVEDLRREYLSETRKNDINFGLIS
jgi:hypothetical protein